MPAGLRWFPLATIGTLTALAGVVAFTAAAGLTRSLPGAAAAAALCVVFAWMRWRAPVLVAIAMRVVPASMPDRPARWAVQRATAGDARVRL